ncbi:ferrous iron transport protein B [Phocaeicola faecicola]|uniref:ferrous iron transport protein B n=1 Tax=Phocaeicola faecicola TaxID=2739389 RepID=UPI002A83F934|nr:ferrous iron transport protein B [Phocaeicola faecicola]MDD6908472.1 ferrous iron transport protein B [Bacteroidaceae bacterium]MDY4872560.1 ferrous iron transport protein B [Phocaeicola faecicola]
MRLSELSTGEKGVIIKAMGHGGFRRRIVEMGFVKGKTVEVILNAPLKDPIKYKIMGYEISLRRQEASMIEVVSQEEARTLMKDECFHNPITENVPVPEEEMVKIAQGKRRTINVALVGNPNCGKTSLFNIASGAHEHVGNYSGVTVDAKEGFFEFQGYQFRLVDLPGTYSLSAYSPEELYVRKHIIEETPDVIINVIDAGNLERNLYLTTQLIDMNVRMVIALNMYDMLEHSGNVLDYKKLGELLGVPIVPTISRNGKGIDTLFHVIIGLYEGADFMGQKKEIQNEVMRAYREWHDSYVPDHKYGSHAEEEHVTQGKSFIRHIHINHGPELERSIDAIKKEIGKTESIRHKYSTRFLAIKLLENDKEIEQNVITLLPNCAEILAVKEKEIARLKLSINEDSEQAIADAKYGFITGALKETYVEKNQHTEMFTRIVDSIVTHRVWGFPIFFIFLYLMFECTFTFGAYPQAWIEWLVAGLGSIVETQMPAGPLKDLIVDGIIGGVGGVIVFLPNILLLYLFISFMEDSGYMARAAFIMDKIMHKMGLHGKSFIPLIMGFGCNVPAIMASRIIESRKSRLVTMLITPFISCSARLPIYLVMIGALFPHNASLVLFSIYTIGILLAVLMARVLSLFIVKGDDTPFVMELPPYRMPTAKSVFRHTWEKGAQYLKKMGGIIMIASIIIWFLGYYPNHSAYDTPAEQQENSYIGQIGKAIEPAIEPLGFNWKMGIGILSGVGAKELVVSTLGVLYTNESDVDNVDLSNRIPITPLVAFGYMLFILIYFPCIATIAAIKQESGSWKWAAFAAFYTTALAWIISFAVYQIGSLFT